MDEAEIRAKMWTHIHEADRAAKAATRAAELDITARAELFMETGSMSMKDVLGALEISRATWYRRVETLRMHEEAERARPGGTWDQLIDLQDIDSDR